MIIPNSYGANDNQKLPYGSFMKAGMAEKRMLETEIGRIPAFNTKRSIAGYLNEKRERNRTEQKLCQQNKAMCYVGKQ